MNVILGHLRAILARSRNKHSPDTGGPIDVTDRVFPALQAHTARYSSSLDAPDLSAFEQRVFSQNGEDGVIAEILDRIGTGSRWFVEFGAGTGHEGNCVLLADVYGWSGLFIEAEPSRYEPLAAKYAGNARIRTASLWVTPGNIEAEMTLHGVPTDLDVLSIDTDGQDYWVWQAITAFRPRLLVIEYNAALGPRRALVRPPETSHGWDGTDYFGSSIEALRRLGSEKGYRLVHTDMCGVNAFFVRDDLADAVRVRDPILRAPNFGLLGGKLPVDPQRRGWVDLDS